MILVSLIHALGLCDKLFFVLLDIGSLSYRFLSELHAGSKPVSSNPPAEPNPFQASVIESAPGVEKKDDPFALPSSQPKKGSALPPLSRKGLDPLPPLSMLAGAPAPPDNNPEDDDPEKEKSKPQKVALPLS